MKLSKLGFPRKHRTVEEFSAEAVGNRRDWFRGKGNTVMTNSERGILINYIMWRNPSGEVTHDQPVLVTRGGAIVLPIDQKGRVGLILKWQPQPPSSIEWYANFPDYNVQELGRWSFEAVGEMGLPGEAPANTAQRGISEETGLVVKKLTDVGAFCADPPTIVNPDFYYLAQVKRDPKAKPQDTTEGIMGQVHFFTRKQVAKMISKGLIYDARTLILVLTYLTDLYEDLD